MSAVSPTTLACTKPEQDILMLCARTTWSPANTDALQFLLGQRVQWETLLQLAERHRVQPLLRRSLRAHAPDAVPTSVLDELTVRCARIERRNLMLALELVRLIKLFERERIAVLPLKGPAMTTVLYGHIGMRPSGDLDLLVEHSSRHKAHRLLQGNGYKAGNYAIGVLDAAFNYHRPYTHVRQAFTVELHRDLADRSVSRPFNDGSIWTRLVQNPLLNGSAPGLAPEDLLVALCLHGAKHLWDELLYICDVAQCIDHYPDLDFARAVTRARELHAERVVLLGIALAESLLGARVPQRLRRDMKSDAALARLTRRFRQKLFAEALHAGYTRYLFQRGKSLLLLRPTLGDRARALPYVTYPLLNNAIRPSQADKALLPLPRRLSFMYYPLRPILVAHRALPRLRPKTIRRSPRLPKRSLGAPTE